MEVFKLVVGILRVDVEVFIVVVRVVAVVYVDGGTRNYVVYGPTMILIQKYFFKIF